MESEERRDFNKEALQYETIPRRIKLANEIADAIIGEIKPGKALDVLDFGCGTGLITLRLQPLVGMITGLDSSQGMLAILEEKIRQQRLTNIATRLVDFEKGEHIDGKYHLIVSSMTIHHVPDTTKLLRLWYELLLPGGRLCFSDLDAEDGSFHSNQSGVFHFGFDRERLKEILHSIGFLGARDTTAGAMVKDVDGKGAREYPVFLITAEK